MRYASRAAILSLLSFCCLSFNTFATQTALPPGLSLPPSGLESNLGGLYYGSLVGNANVSASGNAQYSVPLKVPAGTAGMAPNLSLNYNSAGRNSLIGVGWSVSGIEDSIRRCPKTQAQDGKIAAVNFTVADRFCINGQKLMLVSGNYGANGAEYRTENDRFSRIVSKGQSGSGPAYFEVTSKSSRVKTYGNIAAAQVKLSQSNSIYQWSINRQEDSLGNYIRYQYFSKSVADVPRLKRIYYTLNDTVTPIKSYHRLLSFTYELRNDLVETSVGGITLKYRHRIKAIQLGAEKINFTYSYSGVANLSRLNSIKHCVGYKCQTPLSFEWASEGDLTYQKTSLSVPYDEDLAGTCEKDWSQLWRAPRWHDVNGDGKADYVYVAKSNPLASYVSSLQPEMLFKIKLSSPTGYSDVVWNTDIVDRPTRLTWTDLNRDGKTDAVSFTSRKSNNVHVALSTGSGINTEEWTPHVKNNQSQLGSSGNFYPISSVSHHLIDVDADQLPDLVAVENFLVPSWIGGVWVYVNFSDIYVHRNTGTDFGPDEVWAQSVKEFRQFLDLNGDRLPDIIYNKGYVELNDGAQFASGGFLDSSFTLGDAYLDYNGDGLPDKFVTEDNGSGPQRFVSVNTGTSFSSKVAYGGILFPTLDLNGDRYPDSIVSSYDSYSGHSSAIAYASTGDTGSSSSVGTAIHSSTFGGNQFKQIADVNGDGLLDYTYANTQTCNHTYPGYTNSIWVETGVVTVYESQSKPNHLLSRINQGLGAYVDFDYKSIRDPSVYTKGNAALFPEQDVQSNRYVVNVISRSDGLNGTVDTEYEYEGLKANVVGRGDLGFKKLSLKI